MSIISALPYNLVNGSVADATQVMANFNQIYNNVNANAVPASGGALTLTTITNSTINSSPIGASTPSSGAFTSLSATGNLAVTGNEIIGGTLGVTGATTLSGTLALSGLATLNAGLKLSGSLLTYATPVTVASANVVDLGAQASNVITISGTTTITSFGSSAVAGQIFDLIFSGALTLTYNGTSLILPTGANIVTTAGDTARVEALGSGNFVVIGYLRANGSSVGQSGKLVQWVYNAYTTYTSGTNTIAFTNSIPTASEGTPTASVSITPTNAANYLEIVATGNLCGPGTRPVITLNQSGVTNSLVANAFSSANTATIGNGSIIYRQLAASTSSQTFTINLGDSGATYYINGNSGGEIYGGTQACTILIREVQP